MIGQLVGQYRITEKLGEGGMGTVYKGIDTMIDREVAIKMLRPEIARQPNLLQRFRSEAITVAKLNHAGIATLYNFMQHGDDFFMVMEYVPGKTLEEVERDRGALPWQTAVPLFEKILDAVQPAHDFGILHRDIKPANIMLTTWGAVKVMDFGIARMLGTARMTTEGRLVGTLEYIPPERVRGQESNAAGDIYSLGVVLFEMLGGRLPFQSDSEFELMRCHLQEPLPSFEDLHVNVPAAIERVVRQATAKSPDDRFSSCDAFSEALQKASGHLTIGKKEIVQLVGTQTVQQLGTAGHGTPASGSAATAGLASGGTNSAPMPAIAAEQSALLDAAGSAFADEKQSPIGFLVAHWKLALAAAVVLSIGAGLLVGLATRHSPETAAPGATQQVRPATPPPIAPVSITPAAAPQMPAFSPDSGQSLTSPQVTGQPIQLPGQTERKTHPATKKNDIHSEALKALDQ